MRPSLGISATIRLRLQLKQPSIFALLESQRKRTGRYSPSNETTVGPFPGLFFCGLYFHLTPPPISLSQRWLSPQPLFRSRTADKAKLVSLFQASCTLWVMCVLYFCLTLQKSWQSHLKVLCTHFPFFHAVILSFPACALDWTEIFRMWEVWNGVICVCLRPPLAARRGNIERRKCWLRGRKVSD